MLIRLTKYLSLAIPLCFPACRRENDLDYERIHSGLVFGHFSINTETFLCQSGNVLAPWLSKPGYIPAHCKWKGGSSECGPTCALCSGLFAEVQKCHDELCVPSLSAHSQCFHPIGTPANCLSPAKPLSGVSVHLIIITICLAAGNMGAHIRYALWDSLIVTSTTSHIFALINDSHQEQTDEW